MAENVRRLNGPIDRKAGVNVSRAKNYLMQIKNIDHSIEYQLEEIQRLRDMLTRVTPVIKDDVVSGGGFTDKMGAGIAKIVDLQEKIDRKVDRYADLKVEALKILNAM